MKHIALTKLSLISIAIFICCSGFKPRPSVTTVCATVTFGTPQEAGGVCIGKGVCKSSACGTTAAQDGIPVSFQVSDDNPGVLVMSFSLSALKESQMDQAVNFTDASCTYKFDASFSLSGELFAGLNLPTNAQITPESPSKIVISGDLVTDYITYSTSAQ